MAFSNKETMAIYEAAERYNPGYGAASAVFKVGLGLFEVTMVPHKGNGPDLRVMFTRDGVPAGYAGKARARDPETKLNPTRKDMKPGLRNPARRAKTPKRPLIGRRKTVRMSASGLMSRKSKKAVKRAMHRMNAQAKMLACHACSRKDFITEKSLKKHVAKFHTPGAKSPRGYRTRRDA